MRQIAGLWRGGVRGKLVVLVGAGLLSCVVCSAFGALTPRAQQPLAQPPQAALKPTETTRPTATVKPTDAPRPMATPRPTETPALGQSRDTPIPRGQAATSRSGWTVTVTDFNSEADALLITANPFNKRADSGKRWALVNIAGTYNGAAETGRLSAVSFRLVGRQGTLYTPAWVTLPNKPDTTEVFKGGAAGGRLVFEVDDDDGEFRLVANLFLGEGLYLAVE